MGDSCTQCGGGTKGGTYMGNLGHRFKGECWDCYVNRRHEPSIIAWRREHGYTQVEAGEVLGVSQSTVKRAERREKDISGGQVAHPVASSPH